jgi:tyrosinase
VANQLKIRQGVHNLTPPEVANFRESYRQMMAISDNRGYQSLAGLHGAPNWFCWHNQQNSKSAQRMQLFLPWHRAYLYNWEMAMRDRVAGVTLPWWDWTLGAPRQNGLPEIFTDAKDAGGKPNPLLSFRINLPSTNPPLVHATTRQPGSPRHLPTPQDIGRVVARTDWSDFSDALEDLHNRIHVWVAGDMGIVASAAFDPVFWSHHAMIDRIWWMWQAKNGNANISDDLLEQPLAPFNFRVRDVLNVNDLGYDYAATMTAVPVGAGAH